MQKYMYLRNSKSIDVIIRQSSGQQIKIMCDYLLLMNSWYLF
jgi:hypothetical protein